MKATQTTSTPARKTVRTTLFLPAALSASFLKKGVEAKMHRTNIAA